MTPPNITDDGKIEPSSNSTHSSSSKETMGKYNFERCVEWINARGLEKVCLQFPDNSLTGSAKIAICLEELLDKKVYILGDTTCGSCCIDEVAANHIGADGIVHFGHSCLNPTSRLPAFHILPKKDLNVGDFCKTFEQFYPDVDEKILLFYDVAYAHTIEPIWESLKNKYTQLVLTTLNCTSDVEFVDTKSDSSTIITGRSWNLKNGYQVDDYQALFLGANGKTLASLAMSIPTKSWCFTLGEEIKTFEVVTNPWLKRRRFLVEKLKDAKTVGIVVATLGIKNYLEALSTIKEVLKKKNKKSYIFSVGKPNPAKLANFPEVDVFIVIACPENDIFDSREFYKPLLTPFEVELAFNNSRKFTTHYCLDFRQILPGGSNYVEFQASDDTDVSLLSNGIRNSDELEVPIDKMDALACKNDGTVAIGKAGANFLGSRSWQGLEQRIGEDEIKPAEKGRCGLPISYENEPVRKDASLDNN